MELSTSSRWLGRGKRAGGILLGFFLVVLLLHSAAVLVTGQALENDLRDLRAHEQSLSMAELAPTAVPDAQNGAVVYESIFKRLDTPRSKQDEDAFEQLFRDANHQRQSDPSLWAKVRTDLASYGDIPALVGEAQARPGCRFPVNWDAAYGALLPHLSRLRQLARLLAVNALVAAHDDRTDDAYHSLVLLVRLGDSIKDEPCLISQLVRIAIEAMACAATRDVARPETIDTSGAHELAAALAQQDIAPGLDRAVQGERAAGVYTFNAVAHHSIDAGQLVESGSGDGAAFWFSGSYFGRPILYLDEMAYLRVIDRQIQASKQPWRLRSHEDADSMSGVPAYALMTRLLAPAFSSIVRNRDRIQADLLGTRTFLNLLRFRERTGAYPASLDALATAAGDPVPVDPFSGKSFVYHREGRGFRLYSIGPNLKDDGGEPAPEHGADSPTAPDDIVWRAG